MSTDPESFALLVNPKTAEFCQADIRRTKVRTLDLGAAVLGEGYFDEGQHGDQYGWTYAVTGLPRVHTPTGVGRKGRGDGTALYTALAVAGRMSVRGELDRNAGPPSDREGEGASSGEPRSTFAEAWWTRARERYGLVESVEGVREEEFEEKLSGPRVKRALRDLASEELGFAVRDIVYYDASLSGTADRPATADAYPAARAFAANLVLATMAPGHTDAFSSLPLDAFDTATLNVPAILAGSFGALGGLRARNANDRERAHGAAEILFDLLRRGGASRADIERCRLRFLTGVDDDPRTWQEIGDYGAFVPLRENPATRVTRGVVRRGRRSSLWRRRHHAPTVLRPTRAPRAAAVQFRRNPSTHAAARPAAVREAIAATHALRASLGWGVFAAERSAP